MQVSTATTAELIAFFNANTGGNPVKKFADRKTAERRVQALIDEMVEEGVAVEPPVLDEEYTSIKITESTDAKNARVVAKQRVAERPEMVKSLKLDRQILSVNSGIVYKNACQVWKAGLVSSAQGDRLSATLYGEAKKGNRMMSVSINGHVFTLAVK